MNIDINYVSQFKSVIEDIVEKEIKNAGITTYISAIVQKVNDDGTVDVYLPPDKNNLITGIFNRCGEMLYVGDSVEIATKNGSLTNSWIFVKHGTNIIGHQKEIDAFGTSVVLKVSDGRLSTTTLSQDASLGNSFTIISDDINLDGMNINLNGTRGITITSPYFNVSKTGRITSTSGEIGGWNIEPKRLYSGTGSNFVGLDSGTQGQNFAIWAGKEDAGTAPFRVTRAGALTATSATITGSVTATSGKIGNWNIDNGAIKYSNNVYLGSDGSAKFGNVSISASGYLTATGATIGGTITATGGKIAGYTIDGDTLYGSQVGMDAESGGHYAFWAGAAVNDSANAPFRVGHDGSLRASKADITGTITANAGTIGGCSISNGTLQIANANIGSLSVSKITAGTNNAGLTFSNITATGGTIGGCSITNGVLKIANANITSLNADKISGGTVTASNLNLNSGTVKLRTNGHVEFTNGIGFFTMGPAYGGAAAATHPYVSAINISHGSNIISFRNSGVIGSAGKQLNSISCSGNYLNIGESGSAQGVQILAKNSHGVNINGGSGGTYINITGTTIKSNNGGYMYANSNCMLAPSSTSYYAYVRNTNAGNRIAVASSGPSSLNVKKNLVPLDDEYEKLYNDMNLIKAYNFDYKYKRVKDDLESDYGFIIDEIESTEHLSKYFRNYDTTRWIDGEELRDKANDEEDMSSYESLEIKEWDRDSYIKGLFIMIKTLQYKINELESKIKEDK